MRSLSCSLPVLLATCATSVCTSGAYATSYSESITGFSTLGDHFGYPAFANATYDYVVVGGGTAGLTVAARLAEAGVGTVAVIEAGGFYEMDNGNLSTIPGTAAYFIGTNPGERNPLIDWEYRTEPDEGLGGRSILYNSGKTFGGGSARNYMVYDRGSAGSYAKWAEEVGDDSYELPNFLPYFQKSVHFDGANNAIRASNASINASAAAFGTSGPVHVSFSNWANAWGSWVKLALSELGLQQLPDFVSGNLLGYQYASQTIDGTTQTRSSAETAYLRAAISSNSQLQLYKSTLAKRVLFDGSNAATGVLVDTAGVQYALFASKEVIVSAGAHRSPQLLMTSGIGPTETLQSLGIDVISALPGVGQNLQDQPFFGPSYPVSLKTHSAVATDATFLGEQVAAYRNSRTGYLTNPGSDFLAFEHLPEDLLATLSNSTRSDLAAAFPDDWPHLQHTFADAFYGTGVDMLAGDAFTPRDTRNYVSILPTLVATFSRGNVTINSTDTAVNPVINAGLLSDPRDQELAIAAFKRARQIANATALEPIMAGEEVYPGLDVQTDADILDNIKSSTAPIWHAAGTCKMGKDTDELAVVDSEARVYGVSQLRVVDASAFPLLVPCHPQATVYAFAEKIAAAILGA